jgi:hypothetical protein
MSSTGMPLAASTRLTFCTTMLRIWPVISSVVNSPSVPTISVMKRAGSFDADRVGAEGAQPVGPNSGSRSMTGFMRAPFQPGEAAWC